MESLKTVVETAKFLRVSEQTVRSLIHSGKLKAFKVNNAYRISQEQIMSYLKGENDE